MYSVLDHTFLRPGQAHKITNALLKLAKKVKIFAFFCLYILHRHKNPSLPPPLRTGSDCICDHVIFFS